MDGLLTGSFATHEIDWQPLWVILASECAPVSKDILGWQAEQNLTNRFIV